MKSEKGKGALRLLVLLALLAGFLSRIRQYAQQ